MGLFSKKAKTVEQANKVKDLHEKRYSIPYSKNFRGFKKFPIWVHGNEEAMKNNKILCKMELTDPKVVFVCMDQENVHPKTRMALVFVDDIKAGAVFVSDEDRVSPIENGLIEAVHIEKDMNEERLRFFVKYKKE